MAEGLEPPDVGLIVMIEMVALHVRRTRTKTTAMTMMMILMVITPSDCCDATRRPSSPG